MQKWRNYLFPCVVFFTISQSIQARLFETVEQCDARYGAPASVSNTFGSYCNQTRMYETNGIKILCRFHNLDCCFVQYTGTNSVMPFSSAQINRLMENNSGGSEWTFESKNKIHMLVYNRSDGGAVCTQNLVFLFMDSIKRAVYSMGESIYSVEFYDPKYMPLYMDELRDYVDKLIKDKTPELDGL